MRTLIAIIAALVLLAPAGVATEDSSKGYITAGTGVLAITCAAGGHEYAPTSTDPSTHGFDPNDPTTATSLVGWSLSGEPECLASDVATGNGEGAYFGIAWDVIPTEDSQVTFSINDENFDNTYGFSGDGVNDVEGCGTLVVDIDPEMERHDQSSVEDPYWLVWTWIDGVFADADTTETCFGSVGEVAALYS